MKKIASMILALSMVLAMSVTAFAADITTTGGTSAEVEASYTAGSAESWGDTIYYVTIAWETAGSITYTGANGAVYKWDAENVVYEEITKATEAEWTVTGSAVEVTVTNQSNAAVTASVECSNATGLTVTGSWDKESVEIASAAPANPNAENLTGEATSADFTYTITAVEGTPAAPAEGDTITVATLTVTLNK